MFEKISEERHGRWRLMREFFSKWYSPISEADAIPLESILEAEKRLGVNIPAALREWYLLAGNRPEWNDGFEFYLPEAWRPVMSDEFLILNEEGWYWYYFLKSEDLDKEDPPIYYSSTVGEIVKCVSSESISMFALQFSAYLLSKNDRVFYQSYELTAPQMERCQSNFSRCELPEFDGTVFLEGENTLVIITCGLDPNPYTNLIDVDVCSSNPDSFLVNRDFFQSIGAMSKETNRPA